MLWTSTLCGGPQELYRLSNQTLGYDFCKTGFQEGVTYFQVAHQPCQLPASLSGVRVGA